MPNKNFTFSATYNASSETVIEKLHSLKTELKNLLIDPYQEFIYSTYYVDLPKFPGSYIDIGMYLGILKEMDYENNNLTYTIKRKIKAIQDELNYKIIHKEVGTLYINDSPSYYVEYFQGISIPENLALLPSL